MMKTEKPVRSLRCLGVSLVVLLGGGLFCTTRPPELPPNLGGNPDQPRQLTADCKASLLEQQDLARLALEAMRTYGRIDPGLFDTTPSAEQRELIRVSPSAKPLEPNPALGSTDSSLDRNALERFNEKLRQINAGAGAQRFLKAHAEAQEKCGARCPPTVYPIKVESLQLDPESEAYSFEVQGDKLPSLVEWQQGFLAQYAPVQSACPFSPSIGLEGLGHKVEDKAALASARQSFAQPHTASIRSGFAETRAPCDGDGHTECGACLTVSDHDGKYKQTILGSCCYSHC
jgi:hypothetical protein